MRTRTRPNHPWPRQRRRHLSRHGMPFQPSEPENPHLGNLVLYGFALFLLAVSLIHTCRVGHDNTAQAFAAASIIIAALIIRETRRAWKWSSPSS